MRQARTQVRSQSEQLHASDLHVCMRGYTHTHTHTPSDAPLGAVHTESTLELQSTGAYQKSSYKPLPSCAGIWKEFQSGLKNRV